MWFFTVILLVKAKCYSDNILYTYSITTLYKNVSDWTNDRKGLLLRTWYVYLLKNKLVLSLRVWNMNPQTDLSRVEANAQVMIGLYVLQKSICVWEKLQQLYLVNHCSTIARTSKLFVDQMKLDIFCSNKNCRNCYLVLLYLSFKNFHFS